MYLIDVPGCSDSTPDQLKRLELFEEQIARASKENKEIYITGDMNINLLNADDDSESTRKSIADKYQCILGEYGLDPLRMGITRERFLADGKVEESELDHILTNKSKSVIDHGTVVFDQSDHKAIIAEIIYGVKNKKKAP